MSNIQRDPNFSENESMDELILRVEGLSTDVGSEAEPNHIFKDINLKLFRGKTHALVGESGSGKSMIALSLMRLLPNAVRVVSGNVLLSGRSLLDLPELEMRKERGGEMGMIFQEPMTSLNPVIQVGEQVAEAVRLRNIKLSQEDDKQKQE